MSRIILITGGQRSGKSSEAERIALSLSDNPVYVATAHIWDEEFRERVRRHQDRRGPQWTNIEEEMYLSHHDLSGCVVLIDCVTLWLTNFFFNSESDVDKSLEMAKAEFDALEKEVADAAAVKAEGVPVETKIYDASSFTDYLVDENSNEEPESGSAKKSGSGFSVEI
jgi:adenosyl cobinamide kinase/adenosyl cobinamide phosphate guanylyltransferase